MHELHFEIDGAVHTAGIDTLVIAGWTGRDREAVERHIAELAAIGVRRPSTVPCFYRIGANLLTHAPAIEVTGCRSSGEAEVVLLSLANGLHVAVGSDHTDREVETYDVTVSKQVCPKPISRELWQFEDVEPHWDELILRSWIAVDGRREPYQEGTLSTILPAHDLIARYRGGPESLPVGTAMYCGTLAVNGVIRAGDRFEVELYDPRLNRTLRHAYRAHCLDMRERIRGGPMVIDKAHKEFHTIDLEAGWEVPAGYPAGIEQQILAGSLDENNKKGFRTRHLRFKPGVYTTVPFVHEYWEEVYVVSGDLIVGSDEHGRGGEKFGPNTYACRPPGTPHGPFRSDGGCLLLELHYYDERSAPATVGHSLSFGASLPAAAGQPEGADLR